MRHLTTYERKASEAPEKKREEGSEALKQDLWIAILLDRVETSEYLPFCFIFAFVEEFVYILIV